MEIRIAKVPADGSADSYMQKLLVRHLHGSRPDWEQALRDVAARTHVDLNLLPWAGAFQRYAQAESPARAGELFEKLAALAAEDQELDVRHGALRLLMVCAADHPFCIEALFQIALTHPDPSLQQEAAAFLLGHVGTRERALAELRGVAMLDTLVSGQLRAKQALALWDQVLSQSQADQILLVLHQNWEHAFDLENAFLDRFDAADAGERQRWADLVMEALEADQQSAQAFACDLLTSPEVLELVHRRVGNRLVNRLHQLVGSAEAPIRHYAEDLLARIDMAATVAPARDVRLTWEALEQAGFDIVHTGAIPGREPRYVPVSSLALQPSTRQYLTTTFPAGIYRHQRVALRQVLSGHDVCIATGTASGKSAVFYAAGIETLRNPSARVMAIYPMKALVREQEGRWRNALQAAGIDVRVGRIEGGISAREREATLRQCRVVVFTPDVVHAWLLSSLATPAVRKFLAGLRLVIVDEVHMYTGVFGSNSAFLFRRLQHAVQVLSGGGRLRFVTASATIAEPENHLARLFARPFDLVDSSLDTSPKHPMDVLMVRPRPGMEQTSAVSDLLRMLTADGTNRFIAFVDSRKQTEQLSVIAARPRGGAEETAATTELVSSATTHYPVLPFRSGYEEEDRKQIQDRLGAGDLRGVVSTSALELGLDISGINTVVLVGVPNTATSFIQRIGRAGRQSRGRVIIVDGGGATDAVVFKSPERLFDRPLSQSNLYLENRRIQYIHALCFAAAGGELDMLSGTRVGEGADQAVETAIDWPDGFLELCRQERLGAVAPDLQPLKGEAGDDPWHAFPLRDVGSQFQVEFQGTPLGSLAHSQLMREAYPGAVYYYMATPYRIYRVTPRDRKAFAKRERQYTTKPSAIPPQVFPQLQGEGFHRGVTFDALRVTECDVYVSELVQGYAEHRGGQKLVVTYPCDYWPRDRFTRNYASTGVLFDHAALQSPDVQLELLAQLILEAFLLTVPFDRSEVACSAGKYRTSALNVRQGERFVVLYDQTYGSLRLTGRLLEEETLRNVLAQACTIAVEAQVEALPPVNASTLSALRDMYQATFAASRPIEADTQTQRTSDDQAELVIMPGSAGWIISDDDQEFLVERVFCHPREGLRYYGRRSGAPQGNQVETWFPANLIRPIPGVSKLGVYNYDTGELTELPEGE